MRILLIEDSRRLAQSLVEGLSGEGFDLDTFPTAKEGVGAFSSLHYDAVVLDLGLPDRDGLDILSDLRSKRNEIPILILTARDSVESRVMGLDAGADDYLVKPFAMSELAARMRALLRRPGQPLATAESRKYPAQFGIAPSHGGQFSCSLLSSRNQGS